MEFFSALKNYFLNLKKNFINFSLLKLLKNFFCMEDVWGGGNIEDE